MSSKNAFLALFLGFVCSASSVTANASTISIGSDYFMSVSSYTSGEQNGGSPNYYVGYTTVTIYADNGGVKGTQIAQYNQAFCIDIFDQIHTPVTYLVQAQGVGANYNSSLYPSTSTGLSSYLGSYYYSHDGSVTLNNDALNSKLEYDAMLGTQFNGNDTNDTNLQEAIWDEGGGSFSLNATASSQASAAEHLVNTSSTFSSNDIAFLELNGDGQSFMVNRPALITPTATPEPSSLILLGTGLLGLAGAARRRRA